MLLLNDVPVKYFKFPGGEIQVKLPIDIKSERVILTWKPKDSDAIMKLVLTVNALHEMGISDIDLDILYLPYARQDRACNPGEANSLEEIVKILYHIPVTLIRLYDVHNPDQTYELFDNKAITNITAESIFKRFKILDDFDLDNLILCAPDKGADQRVEEICQSIEICRPLRAEKIRNPESGVIEGMKINLTEHNIDTYNVMVVDDICDGGRTFIEVATLLRTKSPKKLFLYVTHGIFSKGLDVLLEYYEHIYCHHVLDDSKFQSNNRLTILREFSHVEQSIICH